MSDEGEVSRHRKRCFDVAFKLKVVHFAESNSKAGAARAFNIDRKCVQTWTKQKDELIEIVCLNSMYVHMFKKIVAHLRLIPHCGIIWVHITLIFGMKIIIPQGY